VAGKTTAEELERLWTWTGDIIEEMEELRAAIASLYAEEDPPGGSVHIRKMEVEHG